MMDLKVVSEWVRAGKRRKIEIENKGYDDLIVWVYDFKLGNGVYWDETIQDIDAKIVEKNLEEKRLQYERLKKELEGTES
jgi:hypothetical protein